MRTKSFKKDFDKQVKKFLKKVKSDKELDFDDLVLCRVIKKIMDSNSNFLNRFHDYRNKNYTFYVYLEKTLGEKIGENYQEIIQKSDEICKFISDLKLTGEIIDIFEKVYISLDIDSIFG